MKTDLPVLLVNTSIATIVTFRLFASAVAALALASQTELGYASEKVNPHLALRVTEVVARHPPYADFCRRHPVECELRGPEVAHHTSDLMKTVSEINTAVKLDIEFALDKEVYGFEEYWALPRSGRGDCEDKALETRSRLTRLGILPAALRLALVMHRSLLISHCVLTLETTNGSYVLDSLDGAIYRWDQAPYNFEARERPDGKWERFDQSQWRFDP